MLEAACAVDSNDTKSWQGNMGQDTYISGLVTCLVAVTEYLRKATSGRKEGRKEGGPRPIGFSPPCSHSSQSLLTYEPLCDVPHCLASSSLASVT